MTVESSSLNIPSIRYCLNTSTLRGHKLPLLELIEIAAEAGYDGIEPWIDEIDQYVAEGNSLSDLRKRLEDRNLTVEGAIGFFEWIVDDVVRRTEALEEARRNMVLVAELGGKRMAAPPLGATQEADNDFLKIAERYRVLLELGEGFGVAPLVEVWGFSKTLHRLGQAAFVAIESKHPDACILADIYHLYKGGSDHSTIHLLSGKALPILHVNDYPAGLSREQITDADRVYPGDGVAPIVPFFRDLWTIGFDGALSLELFNVEYWKQDPRTVARTGLEKTRALVEQSLERA